MARTVEETFQNALQQMELAWPAIQKTLIDLGHPEWMPNEFEYRITPRKYHGEFLKLFGAPSRVPMRCGNFGCVFLTADPGVICKLTTDESEAVVGKIIADMRKRDPVLWQEELPGLPIYHEVFKLGSLEEATVDNCLRNMIGPVYILWREDLPINDPDRVVEVLEQWYGEEKTNFLGYHITKFFNACRNAMKNMCSIYERRGDAAFRDIERSADQVTQDIKKLEAESYGGESGALIQAELGERYEALSDRGFPDLGSMEYNFYYTRGAAEFFRWDERMFTGLQEFGQAWAYLFDIERMYLADTHPGNVALRDDGTGQLVISDPGLMQPLAKRSTGIKIPNLKGLPKGMR